MVWKPKQALPNLEAASLLIVIATLHSNPVRASEDDEAGIVWLVRMGCGWMWRTDSRPAHLNLGGMIPWSSFQPTKSMLQTRSHEEVTHWFLFNGERKGKRENEKQKKQLPEFKGLLGPTTYALLLLTDVNFFFKLISSLSSYLAL